MDRSIIPSIAKNGRPRVLNIGVHYYTARMHASLISSGVELYTCDIDPRKSRWGARGNHEVCGAADVFSHFTRDYFDFAILSGVLGYGIDDASSRGAAFDAIARVLKIGGILIIGWDENMSDDPIADGSLDGRFILNTGVLGGSRFRCLNGLLYPDGRKSHKVYDIVERSA